MLAKSKLPLVRPVSSAWPTSLSICGASPGGGVTGTVLVSMDWSGLSPTVKFAVFGMLLAVFWSAYFANSSAVAPSLRRAFITISRFLPLYCSKTSNISKVTLLVSVTLTLSVKVLSTKPLTLTCGLPSIDRTSFKSSVRTYLVKSVILAGTVARTW